MKLIIISLITSQAIGRYNVDNQIAIIENDDFTRVIKLVTDSLDSPNSRVMYQKALTDFLGWYQDQRKTGLTRAVVNEYKEI